MAVERRTSVLADKRAWSGSAGDDGTARSKSVFETRLSTLRGSRSEEWAQAPMSVGLELELPALPESVPAAREAITRFCEELEVTRAVVERIRVAVTEACANCVQHAFARDHPNPTYMLETTFEGGDLVVVVLDCGRGIASDRPSENTGFGFGLRLINHHADRAEVSSRAEHGTRVKLRFAVHQRSAVT
jgi:anti-sigma regulatory factor (Ser/Thr protein kinase)